VSSYYNNITNTSLGSHRHCMIILLALSIKHEHVTDRQTDGHTDRHKTTAYPALA